MQSEGNNRCICSVALLRGLHVASFYQRDFIRALNGGALFSNCHCVQRNNLCTGYYMKPFWLGLEPAQFPLTHTHS